MWRVVVCGIIGMSAIGVGLQEPADLQIQLLGGVFILAAIVFLVRSPD